MVKLKHHAHAANPVFQSKPCQMPNTVWKVSVWCVPTDYWMKGQKRANHCLPRGTPPNMRRNKRIWWRRFSGATARRPLHSTAHEYDKFDILLQLVLLPVLFLPLRAGLGYDRINTDHCRVRRRQLNACWVLREFKLLDRLFARKELLSVGHYHIIIILYIPCVPAEYIRYD
jgi:hypothetical protein